MSNTNTNSTGLLGKVFTFLAIFLVVQFVYSYFFAPKPADYSTKTGIEFYTDKKEYGLNDIVQVTVENFSDQDLTIKNTCPEAPLQAQSRVNGEWQNIQATANIDCAGQSDLIIPSKSKHIISFKSWNHSLFGQLGEYKLLLPTPEKTLESNQFSVGPQSFFNWVGTVALYQPIYNALVFFASITPGHNFGLAIILLTILIRTILLIPNQKALKAQKKLQQIQPKILELKEKHGGDQARIAQETMALYKEHKANPLGSCLPILIQLPILLALFSVIQNGLDTNNTYLLYGALQNFDLRLIQTNFLGIWDLTKIDFIILPIIVGGLQYLQLRLASNNSKKSASAMPAEMQMANKTMVIIMPIMIALFTASAPAGLGLYWAVSTMYGIAQQFVINKQVEQEGTQIRVINETKNKEKKDHYKELNQQRKAGKSNGTMINEIPEKKSSDDSGNDDGPITIIKA
ncbi:MAG: YidC/Oxa1 family membrane protein insertase [Candidatus Altimarinota bacterium]